MEPWSSPRSSAISVGQRGVALPWREFYGPAVGDEVVLGAWFRVFGARGAGGPIGSGEFCIGPMGRGSSAGSLLSSVSSGFGSSSTMVVPPSVRGV
jgi:hypothetical protein